MLQKSKEQLAKELAEKHGVEVQDWMLWKGWHQWVGCEDCHEGGQSASCWGLACCHSYENGCGCFGCYVTDIEGHLLTEISATENIDRGSLHRLHDVALLVAEGKLTLKDAIDLWRKQPDLGLDAKIRSWHSDIILRLSAVR